MGKGLPDFQILLNKSTDFLLGYTLFIIMIFLYPFPGESSFPNT